LRGKVGVQGLRKHYGSTHRKGTRTEHFRKASGKNVRFCLNQLQAAGLVGTIKYESEGVSVIMGKSLTKKGITDMDRIASQCRTGKVAAKK
jgi:ribosomal protein S19E (S16A)